MHHHHVGRGAGAADRGEVTGDVIGQVVRAHRGGDREGGHRRHRDAVAIGRGAHHVLAADHAGCTDAVFHRDRLAQRLRHRGQQMARHDVGGRTGGEGHDNAYRAARVVSGRVARLGGCDSRPACRQHGARGQCAQQRATTLNSSHLHDGSLSCHLTARQNITHRSMCVRSILNIFAGTKPPVQYSSVWIGGPRRTIACFQVNPRTPGFMRRPGSNASLMRVASACAPGYSSGR